MGGYSIPTYNPGNLTTSGGQKRGLANQYGINTGLEQQQQGQRGSEFGSVMPGYQGLLNSGYSDQEKSAINQGTTGAISQSYGDAATAAGRHAAVTGSNAGFGSTLTSLARNKGKDIATQQGQNEASFANQSYQRKLAGLQGISSLYGVDTSFLNSLGNQQLGVLGVGNSGASRKRGVLGTIGETAGILGV
jgi:hypothetical protein